MGRVSAFAPQISDTYDKMMQGKSQTSKTVEEEQMQIAAPLPAQEPNPDDLGGWVEVEHTRALSSSRVLIAQTTRSAPSVSATSTTGSTATIRLSDYFVAGDTLRVYTDLDFQGISDLLRATGREPWSAVPRIYTVLRLIVQLQIIDAFIDQGINDIWFPFSTSSLPKALGSALHPQFLELQRVVLTKGLNLETDNSRKYAHFGKDEPLPFKVEKGTRRGKIFSGSQNQKYNHQTRVC